MTTNQYILQRIEKLEKENELLNKELVENKELINNLSMHLNDKREQYNELRQAIIRTTKHCIFYVVKGDHNNGSLVISISNNKYGIDINTISKIFNLGEIEMRECL
jgi:hypothetical protein